MPENSFGHFEIPEGILKSYVCGWLTKGENARQNTVCCRWAEEQQLKWRSEVNDEEQEAGEQTKIMFYVLLQFMFLVKTPECIRTWAPILTSLSFSWSKVVVVLLIERVNNPNLSFEAGCILVWTSFIVVFIWFPGLASARSVLSLQTCVFSKGLEFHLTSKKVSLFRA